MPLPDINPGPPQQVPTQSSSPPQQVPTQSTLPLPPYLNTLAPRPDAAPILFGFGIQSEYTFSEGLGCSPIAGPKLARQVAVWRIHSGMCFRVVTFVCQAMNGKPAIPSPFTGNNNEVLFTKRVSPATPATMPTGEQVWTVVGSYYFLCQQAPSPSDELATAKHPLSIIPAALNVLRPSDFLFLLGSSPATGFNGNVVNY